MKIGIIGSGQVGQTLAKAFILEGHEAMLGTRDPGKDDVVKFKSNNVGVLTGTFEEAAKFAEIIVLATKGTVAENAVELAGKENFDGKIVIDTTNPIADAPPDKGVLRFTTGLDSSLMENIQNKIPAAKVVKAFNSVGNNVMYKPSYSGGTPTMFICGNDAGAKQTVTQILESFGYEAEDMGGVEAARAIEPLCILWCIPGFIRNQWTHAFKLLK